MSAVIRQHLIDPEICIRCNTCEETCPIKAITHDGRNYVVDSSRCNSCLACIGPCPTGAIDSWRTVAQVEAYSVAEQLTWDTLPAAKSPQPALATGQTGDQGAVGRPVTGAGDGNGVGILPRSAVAPRSASEPCLRLYSHLEPAVATVVGNYRVTDAACPSDTRHIVLDFGTTRFPVLEGQSLGIIPPGSDPSGRPHHARQYSVASPRDGERAGYNNVALTVKRVTVDHEGHPVRGVCSNYLCDLQRGDKVSVIGPFGDTFLMPNHSASHLLMICTGTGSAPMRAMTERRRRLARDDSGQLILFFGARTEQELPYFGPLMSLPKNFIDINLAFSRTPGQPRRYVQDAMRERATTVSDLLRDDDTYIYVCGLRGMEVGVLQALSDIAAANEIAWEPLAARLRAEGRLQLETY